MCLVFKDVSRFLFLSLFINICIFILRHLSFSFFLPKFVDSPQSIRKLLELISEFSKVAGYKINTQKSLAFLHTNNEKSEREIKESVPLTIATKRIKYIGINLPKETKEQYTENCKTLMEEIKDNINRWRDIPCS